MDPLQTAEGTGGTPTCLKEIGSPLLLALSRRRLSLARAGEGFGVNLRLDLTTFIGATSSRLDLTNPLPVYCAHFEEKNAYSFRPTL
jgi:hypothetical protein